MRIAWYSNAPSPTGYGVQTQSITTRMKADGHEIDILANYGQQVGVRDQDGIRVWPQGAVQYSLDVVKDQCDIVKPDIVFVLYDVWVLKGAFGDHRVIAWSPVDHYPPPPQVLSWAKDNEVIAMSEFGARAYREMGVEPIDTIWHGVEKVYQPSPSSIRESMKVPEDAFLIGMVNANIGTTPVRKLWPQNLEAVARLMHAHDDVYLYIHTDIRHPNGMPIDVTISALGMPTDRIRMVPPVMYKGSLVEASELARIYSACDVMVATSRGEGFGLTALEAAACGTPSIVSDFSAQPEVVGDTGWKVPGQLDWDHNQGSWFFMPFTAFTARALEEAYAERGTEAAAKRREACVAHAAQFDADLLYETKWRPLLARLEDEIRPRPGKSNAAKRRAKREAVKTA